MKILLNLLGLWAKTPAADAAIKKKIYGSGITALKISNEEMKGIMKIVKSLEESGLLAKGIRKCINRKRSNKNRWRSNKSRSKYLISSHPLTYFDIQIYHQNELELNGVYLRNNLSKIKDRTCIINLDEYKSVETHWIALHVNAENVTYFHSFEVEHIPKEIRKFIGNKNIITNIQ